MVVEKSKRAAGSDGVVDAGDHRLTEIGLLNDAARANKLVENILAGDDSLLNLATYRLFHSHNALKGLLIAIPTRLIEPTRRAMPLEQSRPELLKEDDVSGLKDIMTQTGVKVFVVYGGLKKDASTPDAKIESDVSSTLAGVFNCPAEVAGRVHENEFYDNPAKGGQIPAISGISKTDYMVGAYAQPPSLNNIMRWYIDRYLSY